MKLSIEIEGSCFNKKAIINLIPETNIEFAQMETIKQFQINKDNYYVEVKKDISDTSNSVSYKIEFKRSN